MDVQTLGAAIALSKRIAGEVLPAAETTDAGEVLVVGSDGKWTKGTPTDFVITVSDTTLTITGGE